MARYTYEETTTTWDSFSGEISEQNVVKVGRTDDEDDYVKVYKYLNLVFAYQGINASLIPVLMEISSYMTFADKGQTVILYKSMKEDICKSLNIKMARLDQMIRQLKQADVLRPTSDRGVYAVNPFVVARGKWADIKQLRTEFDLMANTIETKSVIKDKLTGETLAQIVRKNPPQRISSKDVPGQLELELDPES